MATLPTLLPNANGTGPRGWGSDEYTDVDEGIASANDSDFISPVSSQTNFDTSFALTDMPSDFASVDTLSIQMRGRRSAAGDDNIALHARIVSRTSGAVLAAADSGGGFQLVQVVTSITSFTNSSVVAFTYVNTTADKAAWDDAQLEIRQTYSNVMGGDGHWSQASAIELTGTYTASGPPATNLVVADSSHGHTADAAGALAQTHNLTTADASHAHAADSPTLAQDHQLAGAADARHGHGADAVAIAQAHSLTVADVSHGHTADATVLAQETPGYAMGYTGGYAPPAAPADLVVADAAHGHATDPVALTQAHALAGVGDAAHGHTADSAVLVQTHALSVQDVAHGHSAGALVLTQVHALAAGDASHGNTVDALTLTQSHALAGLGDLSHGHAVEPAPLAQTHALAAADARHSHSADATALSQAHSLATADASHGHSTEAVGLSQLHAITPADALHAHSADQMSVAQSHVLGTQGASHGHAADAVSLSQAHTLAAADAAQAHSSEEVQLSVEAALGVDDASHSHAADVPALTQVHSLSGLSDASHDHAADPTDLSAAGNLAVDGASHGHTAGQATVVQAHFLAVIDANHGHAADSVVLAVGSATLVVADASQGHTADAALITQLHLLLVDDALHAHTAATVIFGSVAPPLPRPPSGAGCTLGCPDTRVYLMDQCGKRTVCDVTDSVTFLSWGRELDDDSEVSLTLHLSGDPSGRACCGCLSDVRTWHNELMVVRGGEIVWGPGPLVRINVQRHTAHLTARDILAWLDVRAVHNYYLFDQVDVGAIARRVIIDALTEGPAADMPADIRDACILDYATFGEVGRATDMEILANRRMAGEVLRELTQSGLNLTVVKRSLIVGGEFAFGPIGPLRDEDFQEDLSASEYGLAAATRWYVSSDNEKAQGSAGGWDPYYGLIERAVEGQPVATSQRDLDKLARARLASTNPPPVLVSVPSTGQLSPEAPVCPEALVPGTLVDVAIRELCRPATLRQRLTSVKFTLDETGEKAGITMAPMGRADVLASLEEEA